MGNCAKYHRICKKHGNSHVVRNSFPELWGQISYNSILPCFYQYCTSYRVYCTEFVLILQTAAVSGCSPTNSCHASCWTVACSSTPGAFEYCRGSVGMSPRPFCRCACQNGTEFRYTCSKARSPGLGVVYDPEIDRGNSTTVVRYRDPSTRIDPVSSRSCTSTSGREFA